MSKNRLARAVLCLLILSIMLCTAPISVMCDSQIFYNIPFGASSEECRQLLSDRFGAQVDVASNDELWLDLLEPEKFPIFGFLPKKISMYFIDDELNSILVTFIQEEVSFDASHETYDYVLKSKNALDVFFSLFSELESIEPHEKGKIALVSNQIIYYDLPERDETIDREMVAKLFTESAMPPLFIIIEFGNINLQIGRTFGISVGIVYERNGFLYSGKMMGEFPYASY